jgi:drug/metabolite transporter (DMT)-like permease
MRYTIAICGFFPFLLHFKRINKEVLIAGFFTGLLYFVSIVTQTYGLQTTTAGKAGFITGLSTIMVPIFAWLLYRERVKRRIWIAVVLSISGMVLLLLEGTGGIIIGDLLVLICAVFCAFFIIYNNKYVRIYDVYAYSVIQLVTLSITSFIFSLIIQENYLSITFSLDFWMIMLYMGFATTTLTFLFQNWGQQYLSPSKTAIIFTLEPVFAALFGFLLGNAIITLINLIGMLIIFIAILIAVLRQNDERKNHFEI